jgi:hypothetical protein
LTSAYRTLQNTEKEKTINRCHHSRLKIQESETQESEIQEGKMESGSFPHRTNEARCRAKRARALHNYILSPELQDAHLHAHSPGQANFFLRSLVFKIHNQLALCFPKLCLGRKYVQASSFGHTVNMAPVAPV